ncbi:MAG: MoaD/ThiS family protein [Desulfobacterales bacterium]|nr:MoaD/ThiS family protein [Desulfobacterales bacterium]
MIVNLKCFATLVDPDSCDYKNSTAYELADGQTVNDLVQRAGIVKKDIKLTFVNGRKADFATVLSDGDNIGLAPAVGGM